MMTSLPEASGVPAGPGPVDHPETSEFWAALDRGELVLQRCDDCGTIRFPLAPLCWSCRSLKYQWTPVDPDGTVHAAIRVDRATGGAAWRDAVPFLGGLVNLPGGIRLPGRLLCDCGAALRHGTPVTGCRVSTVDGRSVWAFRHDCPAPAEKTPAEEAR